MAAETQVFLLSLVKATVASAVIIGAALVCLRLWSSTLRRIVARALSRSENMPRERQLKIQTLASVIRASGTVLVGLVAGLLVLSQFMDIAPLLAGAGVVGLAIGLGAQSVIRDVISGFFILLENHFGVGDVIRVNDQFSGYVEHLDLRRTVLRNLDGWVYTIPNGEIKFVANLTKEWSRSVIDVGVAYHEDLDRVIAVLEAVGDEALAQPETASLLLERPEVLGVEALAESQVTIRVLLKTEPMKQWEAGRRYRALVKKAFDRAGVEIPFPHRIVVTRPDARQAGERPATVAGRGAY